MKRIGMILLTLWSTGHCFAQKITSDKSKEISELINAYEKLERFNGAILVAKGDRIIYQAGAGFSNVEHQERNKANGLFRIYSITKTFTSTVIFKLIEQKKLTLDDRLDKFFPGFPKGDSITIENLLTHTSGIYDYTHGNDMPDESEASFIKFLFAKPLEFPPGKGWSYSNSGYWLLGFIIQKITGKTYEETVKEYVFQPLHMNESGFDFKPLTHPDKTTGYEVFSPSLKKSSVDIDPPGPFAAGAIYSSVQDLYKYFKGVLAHELISQQSLDKAWTASSNEHYGYGWQLDNYNGKRVMYHGGGGPGFRSNFSMIPEDSSCVILLSNNENSDLNALTRVLYNVLYDQPYKIPYEQPVEAQQLHRYEGYYQMEQFVIRIGVEDGRIFAQ
ncbi:MAG: class A beta-lactamase-related serine hydrolase, partial [Chitinophagaceae bacterium]